jgi:hypothetical protein
MGQGHGAFYVEATFLCNAERSSGDGQPFELVRAPHPEVLLGQPDSRESSHQRKVDPQASLRVDTGDLNNRLARCVLALAKLHQRLHTIKSAGERAGWLTMMILDIKSCNML